MVSAIGYDPVSEHLHVRFPNGKTYIYEGVTPTQHADFAGSESIGKHFAVNIRGKFPHRIKENDHEKANEKAAGAGKAGNAEVDHAADEAKGLESVEG